MSDDDAPPEHPDAPEPEARIDPGAALFTDAIVPSSAIRKRGRAALILVLVMLFAIGGGIFVALRATSTEQSVAELVPADVGVYVKVSIEPSDDQRAALRGMLGVLPETQRETVLSSIDSLLDRALRESGLSYTTDVKPWLGDQLALTVTAAGGEAQVVVMLSTTDEAKARAALSKAGGDGKDFAFLIDGGFAYVSDKQQTLGTFRARAQKSPLATLETFTREHDRLGGDGLLFVWADGTKVASLAQTVPGASGTLPFAGAAGQVAAALRAEDEGLVLVGHQKLPSGLRFGTGEPALVETTSSALLGEVSLFDPGMIMQQALLALAAIPLPSDEGSPSDQLDGVMSALGLDLTRDVIPWLHGELSIVLGGLNPDAAVPVDAGIVIDPTDAAAATRTLNALKLRLPALAGVIGSDVRVTTEAGGFTFSSSNLTLAVRQTKDRVVIATGRAYADTLMRTSSSQLADDAVYKRVLGSAADKTAMQVFLRLDRIRALAEASLSVDQRTAYERDVKPWLSLFDAFGVRSTISGSEADLRIVLSLER